MDSSRIRRILATVLFVGTVGLACILPSLGSTISASPDETAVSVASQLIFDLGPASIPSPEVRVFPWAHPRSWVSQGGQIVPVGFLGSPWLFSWAMPFVGRAGLPLVAALLIASSVVPLFLWLDRRWGRLSAATGAVVYATMPVFVLYANRSLFPNGLVLAGVVWVTWVLDQMTIVSVSRWRFFRAAGLVALTIITLAIRPIEAVWILPWWVWAARGMRPTKQEMMVLVGVALALCVSLGMLASRTYGSPFLVGYWLRDNVVTSQVVEQTVAPATTLFTWMPYGFHPRAMLSNMRQFSGLIWPYVLLIVVGTGTSLGLAWKRRVSPAVIPLVCGAWTIGWLLMLYGSGRYADHIQPGAIAIGNSFLRYLLPLAPLAGIAAAFLLQEIPTRVRKPFAGILALGCAVFGLHTALIADDESVLQTRAELVRYAEIQERAKAVLPVSAVVFSERSDKIFFPVFRAVSPLPPMQEITRLIRASEHPTGLFARPLDQSTLDVFRAEGIQVREQGLFGREKLYVLEPRAL